VSASGKSPGAFVPATLRKLARGILQRASPVSDTDWTLRGAKRPASAGGYLVLRARAKNLAAGPLSVEKLPTGCAVIVYPPFVR
jgi:hypothetical protein